jgi:multidrug efflux system outer membrane protein
VNLQSEQIGNASMQDVRQAELEYASVRSSLIADQRAVAQDLNNLEAVIGCAIPDGLLSSGALEAAQSPAVSAGVPSDLLTRRPDIVEAEHTLKAANANIGAARAPFFPSIQLTTAAGTSSTALSGLFKAATGAWTFAPTVTMPIFDYGNNRAALDVAKIETQIDVANYEKAIQTAFKDVANALAGARPMSTRWSRTASTYRLQRITTSWRRRVIAREPTVFWSCWMPNARCIRQGSN